MPSTINFFGNKFELYYIGYLLAIPITMIFNVTYLRKHYYLGNKKVIMLTMLGINLCYIAILFSASILKGEVVHGMNYVRVIGFMPLLLLPVALLSRTKVGTTFDFLTPTCAFGYMMIHTGCIFGGCCYGFPIAQYPAWLQWMGIYNNNLHEYLFPVQLCESATCGIIGILLVMWARKLNFKTNGKSYAMYLIMYGASRFFWEFFRNNIKIAGGLSEFSFWCVGWIIEGLVWIYIVNHKHVIRAKFEKAIEPPDAVAEHTC